MHKLLLTLLLLNSFLKAENITLVADEWCPYNCSAKNEDKGYLIELAKEVFQSKGYTVEYIIAPSWEKAIKDVREGRFNGALGSFKTDTPDFIFPTESLGVSNMVMVTRKNFNWKYKDVSSFENIILSHDLGVTLNNKEIDNYIEKYKNDNTKVKNISGNKSINYDIKRLKYKRIDLFFEDEYVLKYYSDINTNNSRIKIAEVASKTDVYISFSPKLKSSKKYAKILSDGIIELRKNGKLQIILNKYGLKDWLN